MNSDPKLEVRLGCEGPTDDTEVELQVGGEEGRKVTKESTFSSDGMKPMEVGSGVYDSEAVSGSWCSGSDNALTPYQELYTDDKVLKRSMLVLYFSVFADAVNGTILQPNYPIMVLPPDHPEVHKDSFPSTAPFGFNAATYFLPMSFLLGLAFASISIGSLSDRFGRKPLMLVCLYGSVFLTGIMYYTRKSFWAFCGASFANGLVSATVPVALAYVSDVFPEREKKEKEIGLVIGISMLGTSGGGIVAILMENTGLFAPLWAGIALMAVSAIAATFCLIEPGTIVKPVTISPSDGNCEDDDDDEEKPPESLNYGTLIIIVLGALADNVGSAGLVPLCLSPLAFNVFYGDPIAQGLTPIMSQVAYKWISTLVAVAVIPGTFVSPFVFRKLGPAGGCILGNIITGIAMIVLLYIALAPPTSGTFGAFVALLYIFFPFTVISQLSTGPMLDFIAPLNKRGFVQGVNIMVMNLATSTTPFLFGMMADILGVKPTIWTCVGISFAAVFINLPLMFKKGLGIPPKAIPPESKPLKFEDEELVEKALKGEMISIQEMNTLNEIRRLKGKPYLIVSPGTFESDKARVPELRAQAKNDYSFLMNMTDHYISLTNDSDDLQGLLASVNKAYDADPELIEKANAELGKWFADYLHNSGYMAHTYPQLTKQMIMTAFPVITQDPEFTTDNVQEILLNSRRVYRNFIHLENLPEDETIGDRVGNLLASGARATSSTRSLAW